MGSGATFTLTDDDQHSLNMVVRRALFGQSGIAQVVPARKITRAGAGLLSSRQALLWVIARLPTRTGRHPDNAHFPDGPRTSNCSVIFSPLANSKVTATFSPMRSARVGLINIR